MTNDTVKRSELKPYQKPTDEPEKPYMIQLEGMAFTEDVEKLRDEAKELIKESVKDKPTTTEVEAMISKVVKQVIPKVEVKTPDTSEAMTKVMKALATAIETSGSQNSSSLSAITQALTELKKIQESMMAMMDKPATEVEESKPTGWKFTGKRFDGSTFTIVATKLKEGETIEEEEDSPLGGFFAKEKS